MEYRGEEGDFSTPDFMPHLESIDAEHHEHINGMLQETFKTLSKSEKLMMRPLVDICHLKKHKVTLEDKLTKKSSKKEFENQLEELEKKIRSRLHVINENGDIAVLVKRFNIMLFELFKKKSCKSLAKMAASALLDFVSSLKESGELNH
jgi:hypothetical protein